MNIIVLPKNAITATKRKQIEKKGIVVIECDEPDKVKIISPEYVADRSDLFLSALTALDTTFPASKSEIFVHELKARLTKKDSK